VSRQVISAREVRAKITVAPVDVVLKEHLVPVQLKMYTESEVDLLIDPGPRKKHRARRAFNRARFARRCFEAYEQGGVLTLLDLSLLSDLSTIYASRVLREYEKTTGEIVPTRGTVHDLGSAITHKGEIVRRWLRHQSPVQIARETKHSQASVDRYIGDYRRVRLLAQKLPLEDVPALTGLSRAVVEQYTELMGQYEPNLVVYQPAGTERTVRAP
jgi:hypothetical protein